MPTRVIFKLREPQKGVTPSNQKETPIIMFFSFGYCSGINSSGSKRYVPLKYSTGEKVKPVFWTDKPTYRVKQTSQLDYTGINTRLDDLEGAVKGIYRDLRNKRSAVTPEILKNELDVIFKGGAKKLILTLNQYIESFYNEIETGKRLTEKGQVYRYGTLRSYKGFKQQFEYFQKYLGRELNFEDITIDLYDEYIRFFNSKSYSPNTIGRHIKHLKTIMRNARDEGLHSNVEIERKKFKTLKVDVQSVYLTEEELNRLYKLDLSGRPVLERVRDVFLVGCYTAQRYSDYSRIKKDNVRFLDNGRMFINLIQQKTGEEVIIPVGPQLHHILKKYGYELPKTFEQKVNKNIKDIAKEAKITEPVQVEEIRGGMKKIKSVPKCDMIKTHTARRTGATNMYLAGIPPLDIAKITGHRSEKELIRYIKVSNEQTAINLLNHDYFNQGNLKTI